ncbi:hypothetical protein AOLI_G00288540 [Acnodon oligacanthus]
MQKKKFFLGEKEICRTVRFLSALLCDQQTARQSSALKKEEGSDAGPIENTEKQRRPAVVLKWHPWPSLDCL